MFGNVLKSLRLDNKLTQKELGEKLNVSQRVIGYYEKGERFPDQNTLFRIADFFDISIDYLLGKSNTRSYDNVKEYDNNHSDLPDKFTTAQDAMKYILMQPVLMSYGSCDLDKLNEDDLIDFANDLLEQFKLLSYKYKK